MYERRSERRYLPRSLDSGQERKNGRNFCFVTDAGEKHETKERNFTMPGSLLCLDNIGVAKGAMAMAMAPILTRRNKKE